MNKARYEHMSQTPAAAPRLRITAWQTLRRLRAHAMATRWAFWLRHNPATRRLYALFPSGLRFACKSFKSRVRNALRSHDQKSSMGFKSGDLAGTCQSRTPALRSADLLAGAVRKLSLSQMTNHGPSARTGWVLLMACANFPVSTSFAYSTAEKCFS